MVGQLQRGAVTSSAGASEEALAPSDPTIYVDTMQPHILKGYNATVHNPQCGVDASCQEGNPPSPELTFFVWWVQCSKEISALPVHGRCIASIDGSLHKIYRVDRLQPGASVQCVDTKKKRGPTQP